MLKKLWEDFRGLGRVCGWPFAIRWLAKVAINARQCVRRRNLIAADLAMGEGPFRMRRGRLPVKMSGRQVVSAIREIWVRDMYLGDLVKLPERGLVVDLGANHGYFTTLAASGGPAVRVVAVEASRVGCAGIQRLSELNGWADRVQIINHFVGGDTPMQHDAVATPDAEGVSFISEDELIRRAGIDRIALLKCDIEGSEFELLRSGSRLLALADQIAIEIHDAAGDRQVLLDLLTREDFEWVVRQSDNQGCIINAKRRSVA
jgi:FkbM family methyltransferase